MATVQDATEHLESEFDMFNRTDSESLGDAVEAIEDCAPQCWLPEQFESNTRAFAE